MTPESTNGFRAIVSDVRAELVQRQTPGTNYAGSGTGSLVPIAVDEYSLATAAAPSDKGLLLEDLRTLLLEARAYPIQVTMPTTIATRRAVRAAMNRRSFPGWDPHHVPHASVLGPVGKVAVGLPGLNRRARRGAAHRRGSSS